MHNQNILISGAGIAGPALAYWLRRSGFNPTIVERAAAPRTGGYMIDFWGVGYDVAERMGLRPALHEDGYRVREVRFVQGDGEPIARLGPQLLLPTGSDRYVSIRRGDLAHRLWQLVEGDVEAIFSDSVTDVQQDPDGVHVSFERSPARRFDLVIGADGLHSNVRRLAFPAGAAHEKYLGYCTAAFRAAHYPHRDEGAYVSYTVPGRQAARYLLRDGHSAFFLLFAHEPPTAVPHDREQREALDAAFGGAGWECDEILAAMAGTDDLYFDTVSQIRLDSWWRGRVALLGDAAYCPSLLSGQGSALAMAGAYVLAHALAQAAGDHARAFEHYQRSFKPFVDGKQRAAERYGGWFAPRSRLGVTLRNTAVRLMRLPFVGSLVAARSLRDDYRLPG